MTTQKPSSTIRSVRSLGLVLAAGLLAATTVTGCVSRESVQNTSQTIASETVPVDQLAGVTLNVGDQKGGTQSLLEASGELKDLPYTINWSTFTSGPPQIEAANAGKIDFALTGNTPPIFGAASQAAIKVVSAYSNSASGDQILLPSTSTITSVAELKGKRIAVAKGSSAHGHLLLQLQKAGLTPNDVTLTFLQPSDANAAFTAGNVDAWAIWDPFTAITQQTTGAKTLVTGEGTVNGYAFGIAANTALADPKRNTALADLLQRYSRASDWAASHPQEWGQEYARIVGIDQQAATEAQRRSARTSIELNADVVAAEQSLADVFSSTGQIPGPITFSDYVDNRYAASGQ